MLYNRNLWKVYYQANLGGGEGSGKQGEEENKEENNNQPPQTFKTFDDWYTSLPENVRSLADGAKDHFERMGNTVRDTREERDTLLTNLKSVYELVGKNKPEEAKAEIEKLISNSEKTSKKLDFYEAAPTVECRNPKAAYAIAVTNDLFKRDGKPDWEAIKQQAPELFGQQRQTTKKKSAGSGTENLPPVGRSMNDLIRRGAGVTTDIE